MCSCRPGLRPDVARRSRLHVSHVRSGAALFQSAGRRGHYVAIPLPLVPTAAAQSLRCGCRRNFQPHDRNCLDQFARLRWLPARDVALKIDKHQEVVTEIYMDAGQVSITVDHTDSSGSWWLSRRAVWVRRLWKVSWSADDASGQALVSRRERGSVHDQLHELGGVRMMQRVPSANRRRARPR